VATRKAPTYEELLGEVRRFALIRVTWIDSRFDGGWQSVVDVQDLDLGEMVTAGMLLDHGAESVTVCLSHDKMADTVYGAITIPLCAVTEIEIIEVEA
jgi:hypothetical protein